MSLLVTGLLIDNHIFVFHKFPLPSTFFSAPLPYRRSSVPAYMSMMTAFCENLCHASVGSMHEIGNDDQTFFSPIKTIFCCKTFNKFNIFHFFQSDSSTLQNIIQLFVAQKPSFQKCFQWTCNKLSFSTTCWTGYNTSKRMCKSYVHCDNLALT